MQDPFLKALKEEWQRHKDLQQAYQWTRKSMGTWVSKDKFKQWLRTATAMDERSTIGRTGE